jgi:sugar phosphate isomerase/epimerase
MSDDNRELVFDFERIFAILKKADYRGFLSLEFEGQDFSQQDELEYIPRAVQMLKSLSQKYAI